MKFKRMLASAIVATVSAASLAIAAPAFARSPQQTQTDRSNLDVVALLVDGSGDLADAHPGLAEGLGFAYGPAGTPDEVLVELTGKLEAAVPDFAESVSKEILSGDPYRVEAGLQALEDGLDEVAEIVVTRDDNGDMTGYCLLLLNPLVLVDTAAVVAQAAAYNEAALWSNQAFWLASANATQFGVQEISALIASEL